MNAFLTVFKLYAGVDRAWFLFCYPAGPDIFGSTSCTHSQMQIGLQIIVSAKKHVYLCNKLGPIIKRQDTQFRRAITVEHRVVVTLWCLGTCGEYQTIGHLFGIARNTVCVIVHDTCAAIIQLLRTQYIYFPTGPF